jgi:uncharacterized membrane protein
MYKKLLLLTHHLLPYMNMNRKKKKTGLYAMLTAAATAAVRSVRSVQLRRRAGRAVGVFTLAGLATGLAMLALTPPFQTPDEPHHFFRIYRLSRGDFMALKGAIAAADSIACLADQYGAETSGGYLPKELALMVYEHFERVAVRREPPDREGIRAGLLEHLPPSQEVFIPFANTSLYCPVLYAPQVAGFEIARALALPPLWSLYLGRFFAMTAYLWLVGLAIRWTPVYKWGMALCGLMPMTLFQAASLSADTMLNAFAFLFTAFVLRMAFNADGVKKSDIVTACVLSLLVGLSKTFYIFIPFLFGIIPAKKFPSKKSFWLAFGAVAAISVLGCGVWSLCIKHLYVPARPWVDASAQLQLILSHPTNFIKMLYHTYFDLGYLKWIAGSFTGNLGWLDLPLNNYPLYLTALLACGVLESSPCCAVRAYQKGICVGVAVFTMAVVVLSLYLSWNAVGAEKIAGVQGRYFIPVAPLLLIPFYNCRPFHAKLKAVAIFVIFCTLGFCLHELWLRYWA